MFDLRRRIPTTLPPTASRSILIGGTLALLALTGCDQKKAPPAPPPAQVGVITAQPQSVPVINILPGRVNSLLTAEVRARVNGIVLQRNFTEGSVVHQGQLLYKIDPAPYIAALDQAKATLQKAQANVVATRAQVTRFKTLVAAHAVSSQDYDNAVSTEGQAVADVAAGKAAVETAQINLGYTDVTAPITGRIGISQVTVGAYVQAANATLMATVQRIDPIYVDVVQSTTDILRLRKEAAAGQLQMAGPNQVKVELTLEDGTVYSHPGTFQFSDITVNQGTGTVTVRAVFPNPDQTLLPGMFVQARITEGLNDKAFLIPEIGLSHDPKGNPLVLVVDNQNKVEARNVTTSRVIGHDWVVDSGLKPGDRIIVQGVIKAQPGATVKPVPVTMDPSGVPASVPPQTGSLGQLPAAH
ncbi:MAG TPA: efflux RND transporter periplasmic adaptor subunit [Stellaceae bacterium]|nr:efflux RND transporter periplasmic adaptor subunit [Stellaceae bacterium]